jgi:hypothetical protein
VVNAGVLNTVGPDAAIENCTVDAVRLSSLEGPVGGAGVWNQAGGEFWMSGGTIADNTVTAASSDPAFGGGVLNAGAMRIAGGSITGNQVDGGGGGVAVVRQPGSEYGGRLDLGGYYEDVTGVEKPTVTGNSADFGGGLAVLDKDEWGGESTAVAKSRAPGDVPSAVLEEGVLSANEASGQGGALMAYGGSSIGLDGPVAVSATNEAGVAGTDGVAIADSYLRVAGDVQTETGGGVALLKEGWPLVLTSGFTDAGRLVIERVEGLAAGEASNAIQLDATGLATNGYPSSAISFAIPGFVVTLERGDDGQLILRGAPPQGTSPDPTPSPSRSSLAPPSPTPTRPTTPPPTTRPPTTPPTTGSPSTEPPPPPTPSATNASKAPPTSNPNPSGSGSSLRPSTDYDLPGSDSDEPSGLTAAPSTSASGSKPTSKSASASTSSSAPVVSDEEGPSGPILTAPEPPPAASSRTIGFALMAIGIFGLAGLGIYVMRRGGFFAA